MLNCFPAPSYSPDFNPIEKLWKNLKKSHSFTSFSYF
ncbi:MAG: transposase [Blastocatellia bacterium]|nr:transposase [Blastocatellia bacterium]